METDGAADLLAQFDDERRGRVFVINTHRRYRGRIALPDLLRATPEMPLVELVTHRPSVRAEADLDSVARAMTDYDLTVIPVLDDAERPIGVITVDDVLEMLISPPGRRLGLFGPS